MLPFQLWPTNKKHHIFLIFYLFCSTYQKAQSEKQKVLLVVFSGLHHDILELIKMNTTSGFGRVKNLGFVSTTIRNEFVTNTSPNLFSLATGLHSGYHGIVDDVFFDKAFNANFDFDRSSVSCQSRWFNPEVKPIWTVAQQEGGQSIVTSHWPGAESLINGVHPTFLGQPSSNTESLYTVVGQTLDMLKKKVTLGLIYHGEPKRTGQKFGPTSSKLLAEVRRLDKAVDQLVSTVLTSPNLKESLNVIITSDHGLVSVDKRNIIVLDNFLNRSDYTSPGPDVRVVWSIWPESGATADSLFSQLVNKSDGMVVQRRNTMTRLYHGDNERIAPIVAYAQPGWLIARSTSARDCFDQAGIHGYDPKWSKMSPFLMAFGPGINPTQSTDVPNDLQTVDVYPLMCHLLNLHGCDRHNGSLSKLQPLLRKPEDKVFGGLPDYFAVFLVLAVSVTIAIVFVVYASCTYYRRVHWKTSGMTLRRARQRKSPSNSHPMAVTCLSGRPGEKSRPTKVPGQLLTPVSDDEEELLLFAYDGDADSLRQQRFQVDDATLTKMLHGPRSRYP